MNLDICDDNIIELPLGYEKINIIPDLSRFRDLKNLYLNNNNISNIIPLQYSTNLEKLWLDSNNINDITSLRYLINLKELYLTKNNINDISPLKYLNNLQFLALNKNNISDISSLQYLPNLEYLTLNNNNISDITVILQYLNKLKSLCLSIGPFVVKEINPQLLINKNLDDEIIKQIYQVYTKDEIKKYENKVKEKFKDYRFIRWITF